MRDFFKDREMCDAATPGPWMRLLNAFDIAVYTKLEDGCRNKQIMLLPHGDEGQKNAEFITSARTGWPAALDEISRLTERVRELEGELKWFVANLEQMTTTLDLGAAKRLLSGGEGDK